MALTVARTKDMVSKGGPPQGIKMRIITFTGDNAYPTGGYALTPAAVGLDTAILGVVAIGNSTATYSLAWDAVNSKLLWMRMGAALSLAFAQAANNEAGVNGTVFTALVIGY